jgi:hypothetical protein
VERSYIPEGRRQKIVDSMKPEIRGGKTIAKKSSVLKIEGRGLRR